MYKDVWQIACAVIAIVYGTVIGWRIFKKDQDIDNEDALAWSMGLNILLLGAIAVCLSLVKAFSIWSVFAVHAVTVTILGCAQKVFWKQNANGKIQRKGKMNYAKTTVISVVLLVAAILYLAFPSYYMWSGRDYGLYIVNAVHTAETGGSLYDRDEFLSDNYDELSEIVQLGYPALFSSYEDGISDDPGDMNAQFLPMYWCLLAVGYSLAGIAGLIRMSAVITLITLFVFFVFVKQMSNWKAASAATLLLAICPAQVWGARITQSEQLAQLVFILAASLFAYGWKNRKNNAVYLAAAVVGAGCFCRMDNYILGLGLLCMAIYAVLWSREQNWVMRNAVIQYLIWGVISLAYGFRVHYHYYREHWDRGVLKWLVLGNAALAALYLILLLAKKKESTNPIEKICRSKVLSGSFILLLAIFFGVLWVQPLFQGAETVASALQQYCWYISPVTLIFFLYGLWRYIVADREKFKQEVEPHLMFIGTGLISTMLYSVSPSITMDHFWMSRRFLPVNFPFLILFGIYGVWRLWESRDRIRIAAKCVALCSFALILIYVAKRDGIIWNKAAYDGISACYDAVADALPDDTLILTDNEGSAAILRYIYHKNIYLMSEKCDAEVLERYLSKHEKICYAGDIAGIGALWGLNVTKCSEGGIYAMAPEESYGYYPTSWKEYRRTMNVYEITASGDEYSPLDIMNSLYLNEDSVREGESIIMNGMGNCFFGPYYTLTPGEYELQIEISAPEMNDEILGTLELVFDENVESSYTVANSGEIMNIPFSVKDEGRVWQIRFVKTTGEEAVCQSVKLVRK